MMPRTWRRWHRWIGWVAALFLLFAATTGILVAATEFFGADEALREHLRTVESPVTTATPPAACTDALQRAFATAAQKAPGAPIDRVDWQCKGEPPTVTFYLGKHGGGEDRKLVCNASTGALLTEADYTDKPFLYRLHSGEAFGDGGLFVAMLWGLALVLLTLSGVVIYLQMKKRGARGWQRIFW
jgi:uncharacterized iron-regulated membrane protein